MYHRQPRDPEGGLARFEGGELLRLEESEDATLVPLHSRPFAFGSVST